MLRLSKGMEIAFGIVGTAGMVALTYLFYDIFRTIGAK